MIWKFKKSCQAQSYKPLNHSGNDVLACDPEGNTEWTESKLGDLSFFKRALAIYAIGSIIVLAIWGSFDLARRGLEYAHTKWPTGRQEGDICDVCGSGPSEAMTSGCKFDILRAGWLPSHCIDAELTSEFERSGPNGSWPYWLDQAGTKPIEASQIPELWGTSVWTTYQWHVTHCMFSWRKEWRALVEKKVHLDGGSDDKHIIHCGKIIEKGLDNDMVDRIVSRMDNGA